MLEKGDKGVAESLSFLVKGQGFSANGEDSDPTEDDAIIDFHRQLRNSAIESALNVDGIDRAGALNNLNK